MTKKKAKARKRPAKPAIGTSAVAEALGYLDLEIGNGNTSEYVVEARRLLKKALSRR